MNKARILRRTVSVQKHIRAASMALAAALAALTLAAPVSAAGKYTVIATLPVSGVLQISADPTRGLVFVGNSTGVTVIDEKTFATTVIPLPEGIRCVVVDPIHWTIYAESATSVYTIDERTYTVLGSAPIALPKGSSPLKMGIDPFKGLLYVSDDFLAEVSEIDEATNSILATIPTPATHGYVDDIGVDPINKLFFVAGHYSVGSAFAIYVGDERTGKLVKTYLLPGSTPGQVIPDPVTKQLYVPGYYDGTLTILDEFTGAVKHITSLPAGVTPGTLTLDPFTETLFTSDNSSGGKVYAVDALTGSIKAIIPTGNGGDGITVDPITGLVFSVNYLQHTISVIKEGPGTPCDVLRNDPGILNGKERLIELYCAPTTLYNSQPGKDRPF
jgi:DNA-binding beta-propeller fold protein YncE